MRLQMDLKHKYKHRIAMSTQTIDCSLKYSSFKYFHRAVNIIVSPGTIVGRKLHQRLKKITFCIIGLAGSIAETIQNER